MSETHYDKLCPAEFEEACLYAHGAIVGWCTGKGEDPPYLTSVRKEAYEQAFASLFDAGYRAALASTVPARVRPRVRCSVCRQERGVSKAGLVHRHRGPEGVGLCAGSRELPLTEAAAS